MPILCLRMIPFRMSIDPVQAQEQEQEQEREKEQQLIESAWKSEWVFLGEGSRPNAPKPMTWSI